LRTVIEPARELPSITLANPVPEQYADSGAKTSFAIPQDAFVHSDPSETLNLSATLITGQRLPEWIRFDPSSGTFSSEPPSTFNGQLKIKVIARDSKGNETSTIFDLNIGKKKEAGKAPLGRISLSEQLKLAGRDSGFRLSAEHRPKVAHG